MKILFFSPNAFLDVHAIPEAIVARALLNRGHETLHVNCAGILGDYCISMSAAGLTHFDTLEKKRDICARCQNKCQKINSQFELNNINFDSYVEQADIDLVKKICSTVNPDNWFDFSYELISVGKYAAYELVLNEKINGKLLTDQQWNKYKVDLNNALLVLFALKKILDEFRPDRLVIYNNLYSINSVVTALAEQMGIPCYSLHAGGHHVNRLSQMTIFKGRGTRRLTPYNEAWQSFKSRPLTLDEIASVNAHLKELLRATSPWVYSAQSTGKLSSELVDFFKIDRDQKVALVTMSSEDEKFAGSLVDVPHQRGEPLFKNYFEWVQFLVSWAIDHPEVKLIIRVHPREFPNKREAVLSAQAAVLKQYFVDLPENVAVNWPSDNVSMYDLLKIVDLGLNSSSTAGLEMSLFGIPVVILDENQLIPYPKDLNLHAIDKQGYLSQINAAMDLPWSMERVINAYRWLSFLYRVESIDISDGYFRVRRGWVAKIKRYLLSDGIYDEALSSDYEFNTKPLKNEQWLARAIEQASTSHIEDFAAEALAASSPDPSSERAQITKNLMQLYDVIGKDDSLFSAKIKHLLN